MIVAQFLADDVLDSAHDVERTDDHYIRLEQRGEWRACCRSTWMVCALPDDIRYGFRCHCIELNSFFKHAYGLDRDSDWDDADAD